MNGHQNSLCLVSCVSQKAASPSAAKDLYTSPLFRKARAFVEREQLAWLILSAEHGLVDPEETLSPYETTLNKMPVAARRAWADTVSNSLAPVLEGVDRVIILAGLLYREFLVPRLAEQGIEIVVPLEGLSIGKQLQLLPRLSLNPTMREEDEMAHDQDDHLQRFYHLLARLRDAVGGLRTLKECSARTGWPSRGIYLFFEDAGDSKVALEGLRVSRVGTHGVSAGSKSTLWGRLAQHRGAAKTGGGNHRGSIFRLLAGEALLRKAGEEHPSWGKGSTAPREVREAELELEIQASNYIGSLSVLWLEADDEPGKASIRADIERNCISLLTRESAIPGSLEQWLGRWSGRAAVKESGLWNNQHVFDPCDESFLDRLERLIDSQT